LSENRSKIDLKVFIIDFESVKNLDDFLSTFAKILIANKYLSSLSLTAPSNMVNFSSTYDKSRRNHELFSNLFQPLVLTDLNHPTAFQALFLSKDGAA